jgi:hypothetical protein
MLNDYRVDPISNNNLAIMRASMAGYIHTVRVLLADDRVVKAGLDEAIREAQESNHHNIVDLLIGTKRC